MTCCGRSRCKGASHYQRFMLSALIQNALCQGQACGATPGGVDDVHSILHKPQPLNVFPGNSYCPLQAKVFARNKVLGMSNPRSKKRKANDDEEAERTLYTSFVAAATAVSQLYTQSSQMSKRSAAVASKQTLVRVHCTLQSEVPQLMHSMAITYLV